MVTRKTKVNMNGVAFYITEDLLGFFFAKFVEIAVVSSVQFMASIANGDFDIMFILPRKVISLKYQMY